MFRHYRAQHEPIPSLTNQIVIDVDKGNIHPGTAVELLRRRDSDLQLEVDSSWPLGLIPGVLDMAFPQAKYLITIRNPVEWIRSRIKYHYAGDPPGWRPLRNHFWWNKNAANADYTAEDQYLYHEYNLCSLAAYFKSYELQYARLWVAAPVDRTLVIRTEDLSTPLAKSRIATHVLIPDSALQHAHSNQSPITVDPSAKLSDDYLLEKSHEHCPTAWRYWEEG